MDIGKLSNAYYPMLAFTEMDSSEKQMRMWERFRILDPEKKGILTSIEVTEKIQEFEKRFQLQEVGVAIVSLAIRKMFFGELNAAAAETKIASAFVSSGGGDPIHAKAIIEAIQNEVATIVPAPVVEEALPSSPTTTLVRLPLLKAMSEYRHLSDQVLTNEKIKLKGGGEPVRPSLGNWLKSYREELGVGVHEPVQRGNFLFQSQNGKRLSNQDRARINLVLKSVEEDFPLEIDPEHQVIVFPRTDDPAMGLAQVKVRPMNRIIRPREFSASDQARVSPQPGTSAPAKPSPLESFRPIFTKAASPEKNVSGETLHFSTGHILPSEREKGAVPPDTDSGGVRQPIQRPTTDPGRGIKAPLMRSPYSIRPLRSRMSSGTSDISSAE